MHIKTHNNHLNMASRIKGSRLCRLYWCT